MSKLNICFAYPWATFGGVERMLLNRALAFKHFNIPVHIHLYFMHDAGGLAGLRQAIERYQLQDWVSITFSLDGASYDLVSVIDSPVQIEQCKAANLRYFVECHTHYDENRHYLQQLDPYIPVVSPSLYFSDLLKHELKAGAGQDVILLRNLVPWDITEQAPPLTLPAWGRRPLLFMARLDALKDPFAVLDAYQCLPSKMQQQYMLLFCGPVSNELDLPAEVVRRGLQESVVILPPVPFFSTTRLLQAVAEAKGMFVSSSSAESFGLSAAEAIASELPVVLSNIEAHCQLLGDMAAMYTYDVGDAQAFADAITRVDGDYSGAISNMKLIKQPFSANSFIEDWQRFIQCVQLGDK